MANFKSILYNILPCWYELSWQEKPPAIILKIHKDFLADFPELEPENPVIQHFIKEFNFTSWAGDLKSNTYGFDTAFTDGVEKESFQQFSVLLPVMRRQVDKPCVTCKGTKINPLDENETCPSCEGSGFRYEYDSKLASKISATFNRFFTFADEPEKDTSATVPQLMTVENRTERKLGGYGISGKFDIPMVQWLSSRFIPQANIYTALPEVSLAVKTAYKHMLKEPFYTNGMKAREDDYHFRAEIRTQNGGLMIHCPGDRAMLYTLESFDAPVKNGHQFGSHNIDSPINQIALLAGLAALHDLARREIKT